MLLNRKILKAAAIVSILLTGLSANPTLAPGVWTNISPPGIDWANHFGCAEFAIDPHDVSTIYLAIDMQGIWKTTDGGSTWTQLGDPNYAYTFNGFTKYLDNPVAMAVDHANPKHLIASDGVRGKTNGFWVSTDGGATWNIPPGFQQAFKTIGTSDMTTLAVDPTDFNHILVGPHTKFSFQSNAGILESNDCGATVVIHNGVSSWNGGSFGVSFLYEPSLGIGDKNTWLVSTENDGDWRTSDGGNTWKQVNTWGCTHGGALITYTKRGVLYEGGEPKRSTDNGQTWQLLKGILPDGVGYYYTIGSDGTNLYAMQSFACQGCNWNIPFVTSPETDGLHWTPYNPNGAGPQLFKIGPYLMKFDRINLIMYSAHWDAGFWALRVIDGSTTGISPFSKKNSPHNGFSQTKRYSIDGKALSNSKLIYNAQPIIRTGNGSSHLFMTGIKN